MRNLYHLHGIAFFGLVALLMLVIFSIAAAKRSPISLFAAWIGFHMAWIAVNKWKCRARYKKYRLLHEAACIYISLLCGVIAMHVWPLRAGSPMNAFWGGIRHPLLGVALGELAWEGTMHGDGPHLCLCLKHVQKCPSFIHGQVFRLDFRSFAMSSSRPSTSA